jgi:hypothetical protein
MGCEPEDDNAKLTVCGKKKRYEYGVCTRLRMFDVFLSCEDGRGVSLSY